MSLIIAALLLASIIFLVVIIRLVATKRLTMKYSFLWLGLILVIIVCGLFPIIPYALSDWLGFDTPSNFIFLVAIFFLLAIALSLSIIVSKQQRRITTLIQELSILENKTNIALKKEDF